ncbi:hypothetical protein [Leyella lascolaii]|uniref:hypothetical protein n=1 Tax=Leyella lascolaii TaxID=1776379 RepID=UPI00033F5329|nr:hypothetical protein [Leyella lascolaii]CCZ15271.1 unknown [Prevotella sp. CAG:487]
MRLETIVTTAFILYFYSVMTYRLVRYIRSKEYYSAKVQLLIIFISTVIIVGIYFLTK